MADDVKSSGGTPAPDSPEYKAELAKMVKGDAEAMGIKVPDEEKKPDEPEEPKPEGEEEPEGDDEDDTDKEEGEDKPPDKYSAALRKLQREESRLQDIKATVLSQQREVEKRGQEVQRQEAELAGFIKQLRVDPFTTLLRAGILTEDDAEYISKQLYYHSKTASADPKNKVEADRIRREREFRLEADETRNEVKRLQRERDEERQAASQKANLDAYVSKIETAVDTQKSKHSLLAKAMEKNPTRTRAELFRIANDLSYAKQQYADPGLVILAWVKERKAFLAELGVNEPVKAVAEKDKSKNAAEKRGTPDGKTNGASAQPPSFDEAAYYRELNQRLKGEIG